MSRRTMLIGIGAAAATGGTSITAAGRSSDAMHDEIAEGDRVATTANLVVHANANPPSRGIWTAPEGSAGYVRDGPADGYYYTWWKVGFNAGHEGWCVETYLTAAPVDEGDGGDGGGGDPDDNMVEGVPYRSQRNNYYTPSGSCQNTCISMLLGHYGLTVDPDTLTERWWTDDGQTPAGAQRLFDTLARENGLEVRATGSQTTTMSDIEAAVDNDIPVMTFGWFTPSGHILVVVGYDDDTIYAHDPYGTWNERYYGTHTAGGGDYVGYDRDAFVRAAAPDGYVWTVIPE